MPRQNCGSVTGSIRNTRGRFQQSLRNIHRRLQRIEDWLDAFRLDIEYRQNQASSTEERELSTTMRVLSDIAEYFRRAQQLTVVTDGREIQDGSFQPAPLVPVSSAQVPPPAPPSQAYEPPQPNRNMDNDPRESEDEGLTYSAESPPYSHTSPAYSPTFSPSSPDSDKDNEKDKDNDRQGREGGRR